MALKNVKTTRSGSKGKGRFVTREEAKTSAKKIRRAEDRKLDTELPGADLRVEGHGSVFLLRPLTDTGREWLTENVANEGWQWLGDALACEPRHVGDVIQGARAFGIKVEG